MTKINVSNENRIKEHMGFAHYPLISWRSVIAGLVFSIICYIALNALGLAALGASPSVLLGKTTGEVIMGLGTGAGAWTILSVLISLLVGGYFSARISNLVTGKIGGAQGIVIASLFLISLLVVAMVSMGAFGSMMEATTVATIESVQAAGWTVFLSIFFGVAACITGGLLGARANTRKPLVDQIEPIRVVPQAI